jgi:GTP-binding protein
MTRWNKVIIKSAEFLTSAVKSSQYPPPVLPEVAFAGRSNVGKSSLINTLINRKRLVKTSATPGRTRLINFFVINAAVVFVDLPGYGYAKVPVAVKKTWTPMVENYITKRKCLKSVVLIMDIRREPAEEEIACINWLDHLKVPSILVLTKADKISKTRQIARQRSVAEALSMEVENLLLFSAKSRQGRDLIWQRVNHLAGPL